MKRIIPVIHLVSNYQMLKNIDVCLSLNVKQVFLINHQTDYLDLLRNAEIAKKAYPNLWIGLNMLDKTPKDAFSLDLNYDGLWLDRTLSLDDVQDKKFSGEIFSGLNFKYQKQLYGPFLDDAINIIKQTSTVACTSGAGTGIEADTKKIEHLKSLLGNFPMALASGVSSKNIKSYLPYVDNFLVASSITDSIEMIRKDSLKELLDQM